MVFITGDVHRDFSRIWEFCCRHKTTKKDILIILGDAGINYFLNDKDRTLKEQLAFFPITIFCIHGNHEARPSTISGYSLCDWHGGKVWLEYDYPNILFAKDGEVYQLETENGIKNCMVVGGAYSVDKFYRLRNGYQWFEDEQPSEEIKEYVETQLDNRNWSIDIVFSHTCPVSYEPREWFIPGLPQSTVDKTTEIWLDTIEKRLDYDKWYCGHYHGEKKIDKIEFMFNNYTLL